MLYVGLAIIVAGIMAALSPMAREWYLARKRKEERAMETTMPKSRHVQAMPPAITVTPISSKDIDRYFRQDQLIVPQREKSVERVDLKVPYAEKDEAKSLGVRWDPTKKVWYVPGHVDAGRFEKWFIPEPDVDVRSASYYIVESPTTCWKCGETTRAVTFMLPAGHESYEPSSNDGESYFPGYWRILQQPTMLSYVTDIPSSVAKRAVSISAHYQIDFSKTTNSSYWMNHCERCGMKQGDFMMHCEPGGAFFPMNEQEAQHMILHAFAEPFEARASEGYGDYFVEYMRKG